MNMKRFSSWLLITALFNVFAISQTQTSLRAAAANRGIPIGAAVRAGEMSPDILATDATYAGIVNSMYSMVEPENAGKWGIIQTSPTAMNFAPMDEIVKSAQVHNQIIRGHNLSWSLDQINAPWLLAYATTATPAQVSSLLHNHIAAVVARYKGEVFAWDVVNEALSGTQTGTGFQCTDSVWVDQPGVGGGCLGYLESAFTWAHDADPEAVLFYNDDGIETPGPKFNAVLSMIRQLQAAGVPIGGIGFETHADISGAITTAALMQNMEAVAALGLQVQLTEVDVRVPVDSNGVATAASLSAQAAEYHSIIEACLGISACTGINIWGVDDKYSWITSAFPGFGAGLPFDTAGQPKSAFTALSTALQSQTTVATAPSTSVSNPVVSAVTTTGSTAAFAMSTSTTTATSAAAATVTQAISSGTQFSSTAGVVYTGVSPGVVNGWVLGAPSVIPSATSTNATGDLTFTTGPTPVSKAYVAAIYLNSNAGTPPPLKRCFLSAGNDPGTAAQSLLYTVVDDTNPGLWYVHVGDTPLPVNQTLVEHYHCDF